MKTIAAVLIVFLIQDISSDDNIKSPCSSADTSCILKQLVSRGLIAARPAVTIEDESSRGRSNDVEEERSNRNSKFRDDCWSEEDAPEDADVEETMRVKRGTYRARGYGRGGRGGRGGPCLWETSYYLGDERV